MGSKTQSDGFLERGFYDFNKMSLKHGGHLHE
jgi:hypothetical protein